MLASLLNRACRGASIILTRSEAHKKSIPWPEHTIQTHTRSTTGNATWSTRKIQRFPSPLPENAWLSVFLLLNLSMWLKPSSPDWRSPDASWQLDWSHRPARSDVLLRPASRRIAAEFRSSDKTLPTGLSRCTRAGGQSGLGYVRPGAEDAQQEYQITCPWHEWWSTLGILLCRKRLSCYLAHVMCPKCVQL